VIELKQKLDNLEIETLNFNSSMSNEVNISTKPPFQKDNSDIKRKYRKNKNKFR
jgi:hypothetical protein